MNQDLLKNIFNDLSKNEFTDVTIEFIDINQKSLTMKFHKMILSLQCFFFRHAFHFNNKDAYTFDNLESIEIAKIAILTLYGQQPIINNSLEALQLVKTCDFFSISFDFDWIKSINYENNIKHLKKILNYIENPNFLFEQYNTPMSEIKSAIRALKNEYWLLPNMFITYYDTYIRSNTVDDNNKGITYNSGVYNSTFKFGKHIYPIGNNRFIGINNKTVYELFIHKIFHEKQCEKLFEIPIANNFIIHDSKLCCLDGFKLFVYDLNTLKCNEIDFHLPRKEDLEDVLLERHMNTIFIIKGIINDFNNIIVSPYTKSYDYSSCMFICSRSKDQNIKKIFKIHLLEFKITEIIDVWNNITNINKKEMALLISKYETFYYHSNNYFWNSVQKCFVYFGLSEQSMSSYNENSKFNIEIINYENNSSHTIKTGNIINNKKIIIANSTKYPVIAYTNNTKNKITIFLLNLSTLENKIIFEISSGGDLNCMYFICDQDYLYMNINNYMYLYSLVSHRIIFAHVPHTYSQEDFLIKFINIDDENTNENSEKKVNEIN